MAGRYSATFDPVGATAAADMGITEDGWTVGVRVAVDDIGETDKYGSTVVDGIYRGYQDVKISGMLLEYLIGANRALFTFNNADFPVSGAGYLGPGVIGRLASAAAGIIILTATSSTPSAAAPASLTATYCAIMNGHEVAMSFNSKLRKTPGVWRVYPYDDTGVTKHLTVT